jgi:hypothetical protein
MMVISGQESMYICFCDLCIIILIAQVSFHSTVGALSYIHVDNLRDSIILARALIPHFDNSMLKFALKLFVSHFMR